MGLLLACLVIGLVVLYPPVRQIIFKGVYAVIVGGVVLLIISRSHNVDLIGIL